MAVTKTNYGKWITLEGTIAEVAGALSTNKVQRDRVIAFGVDVAGTGFYAVYTTN